MREYFTEMSANYNMLIAEKNRLTKWLFTVILVLVIILVRVIGILYITVG